MGAKSETVYLSLGSNLGDRRHYIEEAVRRLNDHPEIEVEQVSSLYETAAWGFEDQADFYNVAAKLTTCLSASDLLGICQRIEIELDRIRNVHWGPRTLDIDILLYGEKQIETDELVVPHALMLKRAFVLVPLIEIDAHLKVKGILITAALAALGEEAKSCRKID